MNTATIRLKSVALPPPPRTVFGRFVWKELRTLRSFWLAVAGLALAGQWLTAQLVAPSSDLPSLLFATALGAAVVYAVGASATLFAVEHEEGTYDFLSALPAQWSSMFWGKLFAAGSSAVALAMVLSLGVVPMAGQWPESAKMLDTGGLFGLAIPEVLVWGTLFSLLLKRPLVAALLAIAAALVAAQLTVNVVPVLFVPEWYQQSNFSAAPFRFGMVLLVLAADLWLARRWWPVTRHANPMATFTTHEPARTMHFPQLCMIGRLAWQTWRQSWPMMAWMLGLLYGCGLLWTFWLGPMVGDRAQWGLPLWGLLYALSLVGPAIYSSAIFHADHRGRQVDFLATHAVSGRYIWFTRLLVWAIVLILPTAILSWATRWLFHWLTLSIHWLTLPIIVWGIFPSLAWITGFALGQFCSLLFRQSLVAAFLAVLLAVLTGAWMLIMAAWELPWIWFVLPLPLGLLGASWLRAPDWIAGRNSLVGWTKVALALGLPGLLIAIGVPAARLAEVPEVPANLASGCEPVDLTEANEVGEQLLQLGQQIAAVSNKESVDAALQEQLQRVLTLCAASAVRFPDLGDGLDERYGARLLRSNLGVLSELVLTLSRAGDQATEAGELDQALEYYLASWRLYGFGRCGQTTTVCQAERQSCAIPLLHWALQEGQTSARIKRALGALEALPPWATRSPQAASLQQAASYQPPNPADNLWADHRQVLDVLAGRKPPRSLHKSRDQLAYLANRLPFERTRAVRVLAALTGERIGTLEKVRAGLALLQNPLPTILQRAWGERSTALREAIRQANVTHNWSWLRTSYLLRYEYARGEPQYGQFFYHLTNDCIRHAALQVQLALSAYRLDHEAYPVSLNALVPDYLAYVPLDPYAGEPFGYHPDGVPGMLTFRLNGGASEWVDAGTPFIWSVGARDAVLEKREVEHAVYGEGGGRVADGGTYIGLMELYFCRHGHAGGSELHDDGGLDGASEAEEYEPPKRPTAPNVQYVFKVQEIGPTPKVALVFFLPK